MASKNELHAKVQQHLAEWRASGLTQASYCAAQGLKATTFNTWLRRDVLAQSSGQSMIQEQESMPAQLQLPAPTKRALTLVRAWPESEHPSLAMPPSSDHWQLRHASGWCLTLPGGVAPTTVAALLRALA